MPHWDAESEFTISQDQDAEELEAKLFFLDDEEFYEMGDWIEMLYDIWHQIAEDKYKGGGH